VHIGSFLIPHAKTAELIQPCEAAFHDPAPSPQPATMFRIAHCEPRQDLALAQGTPNALGIVGPVPQHTIRATAGPTTRALEQRKGICHSYVSGKSFGLIGQSISWGAPKDEDMAVMKEVFASWVNSSYTDHLHAQAMIDCAGCHGKELPLADSTVENGRCLACHGPQDQLAARSRPQDFPKRNPHDSHLGEIACTVCHHAHAESKVYCLDCHRNFVMKISGRP